MTKTRTIIVAALAAAPLVGEASGTARAEFPGPQMLFYGGTHDCDGQNFGGHLPEGFVCRGTGTGVGICAKSGDTRIVRYEVAVTPQAPSGYCRLDFSKVSQMDLNIVFKYLKCKGSMPDCAIAAFSNDNTK
jgi:hypothetical protein